MPLLHGDADIDRRDAVFSEIDYACHAARDTLGVGASEAHGATAWR